MESLETENESLYTDLNTTSKVMLGLLALCGLLSKDNKVFIDNYYKLPELFTELDLLDTYACGTIQTNKWCTEGVW